MSLNIQSRKGVAVLTIRGILRGGSETSEVHEKVKTTLEDGVKNIVIDLSRVKWLNSQALGMLVSCLSSVRKFDGKLGLAGGTKRVRSLFLVTRLITIFDTFDSSAAAVEALASQKA